MLDLNRLAQQYAGRRVTVLAITEEAPEQIALVEQKVMPLRTSVATFRSDQPRGALATSAYGGRPTTVIVDRDGSVRDIFIGRQSFEHLRRAVDKAL
jgi:hypothetical protein